MALSGLHITCGFVGVKGGAALLATASWSQTMPAAGTTGQPAVEPETPRQKFDGLLLAFEVTASQDAFVVVGGNPNITTGARIFVPSGTSKNVFCNSGDLLAWTFA